MIHLFLLQPRQEMPRGYIRGMSSYGTNTEQNKKNSWLKRSNVVRRYVSCFGLVTLVLLKLLVCLFKIRKANGWQSLREAIIRLRQGLRQKWGKYGWNWGAIFIGLPCSPYCYEHTWSWIVVNFHRSQVQETGVVWTQGSQSNNLCGSYWGHL